MVATLCQVRWGAPGDGGHSVLHEMGSTSTPCTVRS